MQVICSICKTANPDTNKFCGKCGASLESAMMVQEIPKQAQKTPPKKSKMGLLLIIFGFGFLGCMVCGVLTMIFQSTPTTKSTVMSPIVTPTMSVEEIKAAAKQIPYDELARNTENHIGELIYFRGKVVQVIEKSGQKMGLRVEVTEDEYGYWDDLVWVNYEGPRLVEDDIIQFWGSVEGRYSYTTVLGAEVTIPEINALELTLK